MLPGRINFAYEPMVEGRSLRRLKCILHGKISRLRIPSHNDIETGIHRDPGSGIVTVSTN